MFHPKRDADCLTPNNQIVDLYTKRDFIDTRAILSPPLSPYRSTHPPLVIISDKSYMATPKTYKIENFKDYKLTINPWSHTSKANLLNFLNQYEFEQKLIKRVRRKEDEVDDRMRTRRRVERSETEKSDEESPKKKRKETATPVPVFEDIPDHSPDPLTLPSNPKCLKIEWKGQPMDLSNDPNIHLLHPAEIILASVLRLPVLVYLDSKKRLFFEKRERVIEGKQFRRTDAQKACRIDVNKASRLFAAFEKVGWLEDEHFS